MRHKWPPLEWAHTLQLAFHVPAYPESCPDICPFFAVFLPLSPLSLSLLFVVSFSVFPMPLVVTAIN